jgi:hypothetical protein
MNRFCAFLAVLGIVVSACAVPRPAQPAPSAWSAPERVTIQGYSGTAQDPWITSDGKYLLFDTHSDAMGPGSGPGEIRYAQQIDYKTFQYVGAVKGLAAGDPGGVAAPATDDAGNFYFLTGRYANQGMTIGRGSFAGGTVSGIAPVIGINGPGMGNMSASPSRDGQTLVFSDNSPRTSTIEMASRNADGSFTRLPNSDAVVGKVNDRTRFGINYGPSLGNGALEVYFVAPPQIYVASRASANVPFGTPQAVQTNAIDKMVEGPCLSADGHRLYYHKVVDQTHSEIWVLSR